MSETLYTYRVDANDRLREVNADWLAFARENEAPELTEEAVLGRLLWDFVDGEATRQLYAAIFATLREQPTELRLPFRCDSPTRIRQMALTLRSAPGGGVELEGRLLRSEERAPVLLFDRKVARGPDALPICSVCRRVNVDEEWIEVAEIVVRQRLFARQRPPRLLESVCPRCVGAAK